MWLTGFGARHGLLLLQDKNLPNAVTEITGEHVSGSWWSHPRSHEIFWTIEQLPEKEVITTKLIGGKVTFVHRKLWPALFAIGSAREAWQMRGLSREASALGGLPPPPDWIAARWMSPTAEDMPNRVVTLEPPPDWP